MGVPTGGNLGTARGSIVIDTSQLAQAQAQVNAFAASTNTAMGGMNRSINSTQSGITSLAGSMKGLAGALGFSIGIQSLAQLSKAAGSAAETATAYQRQEVAARSLAGSQQKVNELLEAYERATGGAVDKATALANVTRLQATGFAKNAAELERFVRAVRGISLAMGKSQEEITQEVQLAIANTSMRRLDQIGLSIREVTQRMEELRAANAGMTREMAFQQAVLDIAEEKYGTLADSAAGQASGVEKLTRKWKDYGTTLSQVFGGPINAIAGWLAGGFDEMIKDTEAWIALLEQARKKLQELGILGADLSGSIRNRTSIGRVTPRDMSSEPFAAESREIRLDWARGVTELNARTNEELTQQNTEYQRNRADLERSYQKTLTREAEDFARSRLRQEQELADSIADIHEDAARRDQREAESLARNIGRMQSDANEKVADLEESYQRDRERRAREHRDNLLDAAGRLDAKAVAEAQRNFRRQEQDAKEARDEQRAEIREQVEENIAEARAGHERQLAEARAADARRIQEMQADFAKRQQQEADDRATRLSRMAEDHADQLIEMDRAHQERISQITRHAEDERRQLDEEAKEALIELGTHNQAWLKEQAKKEEELEKLWDKFWGHVNKRLTMSPMPSGGGSLPTTPGMIPGFASGGIVPRDMLALVHRGEHIIPATQAAMGGGMGGATNMSGMTFNIYGAPGQSPDDIGKAVRFQLERLLEEIAS